MLSDIKGLAHRALGPGVVSEWKLRARVVRESPGHLVFERAEGARGVVASADVVTIMPTIGRPSLVPAVESALAQAVPRHTVVVITDGPVGLPALPDSVVVIHSQRNTRSAGLVRNIGIRRTISPFIAFLDDDNVWHEGHLQRGLDALSLAHLSYSSIERVREDGSLFDTVGQPWDRRAAAVTNFVDMSAIVMRRGPLVSRLPRERMDFAEDWELVHRVARRHKVRWTGAATVRYTLRPDLLALLERQLTAD